MYFSNRVTGLSSCPPNSQDRHLPLGQPLHDLVRLTAAFDVRDVSSICESGNHLVPPLSGLLRHPARLLGKRGQEQDPACLEARAALRWDAYCFDGTTGTDDDGLLAAQ